VNGGDVEELDGMYIRPAAAGLSTYWLGKNPRSNPSARLAAKGLDQGMAGLQILSSGADQNECAVLD
jgi:hypothetical protein